MIELIERAVRFQDRIAVRSDGIDYTYRQLLERSHNIALQLLGGKTDLDGSRIAFLVPASFEYVCINKIL